MTSVSLSSIQYCQARETYRMSVLYEIFRAIPDYPESRGRFPWQTQRGSPLAAGFPLSLDSLPQGGYRHYPNTTQHHSLTLVVGTRCTSNTPNQRSTHFEFQSLQLFLIEWLHDTATRAMPPSLRFCSASSC